MDDLCRQLFGCSWTELRLDAVERFLAEAHEGGVSWQAVGGDLDVDEIRRQVCALANSERGGYLLLGVDGDPEEGWRLSGAASAAQALGLWVDAAIDSGVSPRPPYEAKTLPLVGNRHLVVLQVPPVDEPPCMTGDGALYARTTAGAARVTDPSQVAELFRRGEAARHVAAAGADALAAELREPIEEWPIRVVLALAAPASPAGVDARLFTTMFDDALRHVAALHLGAGSLSHLGYEQDRVAASLETFGPEDRRLWLVEAVRSGAVGAAYADRGVDHRVVDLVARIVQPLWRVAADLLAELDPGGTCHLKLLVGGGEALVDGPRDRTIEVTRTVAWGYPGREDLASIRRELDRASGRRAHEPVAAGEAGGQPRPGGYRAPRPIGEDEVSRAPPDLPLARTAEPPAREENRDGGRTDAEDLAENEDLVDQEPGSALRGDAA